MPKSRFPKVYHSEVVPLGTHVLEHHGCSGVLLKGERLSLEETTKVWNELPRNQSAMKRLPSTTSSLGRSFIGSLFESLGPEICRRRPSHQGAVRSSNHTGSSTRSSRPVHSPGQSVVDSFGHSLLIRSFIRPKPTVYHGLLWSVLLLAEKSDSIAFRGTKSPKT